jgi:hypothetical protein
MSDEPCQQHTLEVLPRWVVATLLASLIFGLVVRLIWVEDMEWKADEIYSVEHAQRVLQGGAWPATGMGSSVGLPNPGFSLWAFVPLVAVGRSPLGVCRLIMLLNTAAMLGFAAWSVSGANAAGRPDSIRERGAQVETWLWGVGLMAVNPYVVRISRKIWPPSLLAPLTLLLWVGYSKRSTRLGAFGWGLAGAVIGQVHLSGIFLAGGIFLATLVDRLHRRDAAPTCWVSWLFGSACGAAGLVSWFGALRENPGPAPILGWSLESFYLRFVDFCTYWTELALGQTAGSSYTVEFYSFLDRPVLAGVSSHLFARIYEALGWIGGFGIITWALTLVVSRLPAAWIRSLRGRLRRARHRLIERVSDEWKDVTRRAWLVGHRLLAPRRIEAMIVDDESRFAVRATGLAGATLLILTCRIIHLHYVYVFSPFVFVWLATVFARRRRMLAILLALQAVLTLGILIDLHVRGGAPAGDYGKSYSSQHR